MRSATVLEIKDKILTLVVAHPRACSRAARRLLATREGTMRFAVLCDAVGPDYSKQLFDGITERQWAAIEQLLRENPFEISRAPAAEILAAIHLQLLSESMTWDPARRNQEDPFAFLRELPSDRLAAVLKGIEPSKLAFIATHWGPEEMARILAALSQDARRETVLQISRLDRLPEEAALQVASSLATLLRARLVQPPPFRHHRGAEDTIEAPRAMAVRLDVEDPVSAAIDRLLAGIDVEQDNRIMEFLRAEAPAISKRVEEARAPGAADLRPREQDAPNPE